MAHHLTDHGRNNQLQIESPDTLGDLHIVFNGDNNRVRIGRGCRFNAGYIELNDACSFEAKEENLFNRIKIYGRTRARFFFGSRNGFTWETSISAHEESSIRFGSDCIVASGCSITSSDMHSIIEISTKRRINPPADVVISDHVWLGDGVRVLKGAQIGRGSIIGAGSIVTARPIPENVVAVGSPARVVKRGVTWTQELIDDVTLQVLGEGM